MTLPSGDNTDLRNQIVECIKTNQFSMYDFNEDNIFDIFCDENSEISIDRVLYELEGCTE